MNPSSTITRHAVLAAASLALAGSAQAVLFVSGSVGGAPTGVNKVNFDDLSNGATGALTSSGPNGSVSLQITPNARVAVGSVSGQYAAPYLSGSNGTGFGNPNVPGPDTTPYLTSGSTGNTAGAKIRITFDADKQYMGLLWGSVDSYNTLSFFDKDGNSVGSVTGANVVGSPNGNQGVNGTLYVNINSTVPFRYVEATSTSFAFEFDNVAYNTTQVGVPDTGWTLGMAGLGLVALGCLRRRMA